MRIRVLYFAVVRERLRRDEEALDLPAGATVGSLLDELARRHEPVAALRRHLQVARNRETARPGDPLADGDEIALIPPVAGGADSPAIALRSTPLSVDAALAAVAHPGAGAVVTFIGLVRKDGAQLADVVRLDYEAYDAMALAAMQRIADDLARETPGVRVAIHHRTGSLTVGEPAVILAASAPHRAEAFAAARTCIERLKKEVPIWKKELSADGASWIGLGP